MEENHRKEGMPMKSFARCFIAQTSLVAFALNEKAVGEDYYSSRLGHSGRLRQPCPRD